MQPLFAHIALPVPLPHLFTYSVPGEFVSQATVGSRVLGPFGKKTLTGVVVSLSSTSDVKGIKPIADVLDAIPSFSSELLKLSSWIADYYHAPLGEVLRASSPHGAARESRRMIRLIVKDTSAAIGEMKSTASKQRAILAALQSGNVMTAAQLAEKTHTKSIHAVLNEMARRGWISIEEEIPRAKASIKRERFVFRNAAARTADSKVTAKQQIAVAALQELSEPVALSSFLKSSGVSSAIVTSLIKKGIALIEEREVIRSSDDEPIQPPQLIVLNSRQEEALREVQTALTANTYQTFLLHGVTGSGKTQVYIDAIRSALEQGKSAIVLVPEISLTPQTVRRFKAHFGSNVAVMHSQMSSGERFDTWRLAHEDRIKIVIGPRSAIFAPLKNLGLIVVDEEHESSYKQYDSTPRYNARDVAVVRGSFANAVVVLGSATPSIESYYNAQSGKYRLLELPERVDHATMPNIAIVDMRSDKRKQYEETKVRVKAEATPFPKTLPARSISGELRAQIDLRLGKREGVILLQNRRGFSHIVECFECGYVERCDHCDVSLTYHATKKHLRCHYCGAVKQVPASCPQCNGNDLRNYAFGTQQVEQELTALFPQATIVRMDRDSTSRKGAHERILTQFGEGKADILLGTQMVAKGLDFPRVTLVGVISADTQMLLPDFRASEQTFQLLTQVAGRAGRSTLAGEVLIQSMQTDHYTLKHVLLHDYRSFYKEELEFRRELEYPPFSRIVLIECSGPTEGDVEKAAKSIVRNLFSHNPNKALKVLGPADAAIPRLRGSFRKHIVIKDSKSLDPSGRQLHTALDALKKEMASDSFTPFKKIRITIDIDPYGMM